MKNSTFNKVLPHTQRVIIKPQSAEIIKNFSLLAHDTSKPPIVIPTEVTPATTGDQSTSAPVASTNNDSNSSNTSE